MKLNLTLSLALAALATSGVALAQAEPQAPPQGAHRAARAPMTKEQAAQMADRAFDRLDINKDGALSEADREAQQKAMFDRVDADKDGAISFAEFQSSRTDRREARADRREARPEPGARGQGAGLAARRMGRGAGFGGAMRLGAMARNADADQDGAVSKGEFRTAALARFDAADANADGSISPDERRSMRGPGMRRGMPPRAPAG